MHQTPIPDPAAEYHVPSQAAPPGRLRTVLRAFIRPAEPTIVQRHIPEAATDLYTEVGAFLSVNGLDPTPVNYATAYAAVATRRGLESEPPATTDAERAAAERREADEALARVLNELIDVAQARVDEASRLLTHSGDDVRDFGVRLESGVSAMNATASAADMVTALVGVTRSMIEYTRAAENRMRVIGGKMDALQASLSTARDDADRDSLTGLPNRAAMARRIEKVIAAARALGAPVSLAYCDVDHFKRVNETHGHAVGDRVLRLVADCLAEGCGDAGHVARQGGEEFLMLFDGLPAVDAHERVDAIREMLAARRLTSRVDGSPIGRVTFSAGVTALVASDDCAGQALIDRADRLLAIAKQSGRNHVTLDVDQPDD